jgi:starch phosphorylase
MKVLVNGGLNLSELDGWWAEAYRPGVGWALGDAREHDDDPALDVQEAAQLYRMLEEEVAPCFYDRDAGGIPRAWVARVRASMSELTPLFSSNRMLREYVERLYLPAAEAFRERTADGALKARLLCRWRGVVESFWPRLHFGQLEVRTAGDTHTFRLPVYMGELDPEAVAVQLYADPQAGDEPATHPMERGKPLRGDPKGYEYTALVPATRPPAHFTPRAFPLFEGARLPLEEARILWYA